MASCLGRSRRDVALARTGPSESLRGGFLLPSPGRVCATAPAARTVPPCRALLCAFWQQLRRHAPPKKWLDSESEEPTHRGRLERATLRPSASWWHLAERWRRWGRCWWHPGSTWSGRQGRYSYKQVSATIVPLERQGSLPGGMPCVASLLSCGRSRSARGGKDGGQRGQGVSP